MSQCADSVVPDILTPYVAKGPRKSGVGAWAVYARGLEPSECFAYFARKRDAEAAARKGVGRWVAGALRAAEIAGRIIVAPLPGEIRACGPHDREPWDRAIEGWWSVGLPVPISRLGGVSDLARFRLGWSAERWVDALLDRGHWQDPETLREACAQAEADLGAGRLTSAEAESLGASEATISYLRLSAGSRAALAECQWHTNKQEAGTDFAPLPEEALCRNAPR